MNQIVYAVCCTSRSGSTYLCQLLASTGRLGKPKEYLNDDLASGRPHWSREVDVPVDCPDTEYIEAIIRAYSTDRVFGTKALLERLRHYHASLQPTHYLFLRRRDTLRQAISLYRAQKSGRWGHYNPANPPPKDMPFDGAAIRRLQQQIEAVNGHWAEYFAGRQITPLPVWYEDICADPMGQVRRIAQHMGISLDGIDRVSAAILTMRDEVTEDWVRRLEGKASKRETTSS